MKPETAQLEKYPLYLQLIFYFYQQRHTVAHIFYCKYFIGRCTVLDIYGYMCA